MLRRKLDSTLRQVGKAKPGLLFALVVLLFDSPPAWAAPEKGALEILKRMSETYRTLECYQFEGTFKKEMKATGYQQIRETPFLKAAILPDKLRVERGWPKSRLVLVSDGQASWLFSAQLRQYSKSSPADMKLFLEWDSGGEPGTLSVLNRGFGNDYGLLADQTREAKVVGEESLRLGDKGADCYLVEVSEGERAHPDKSAERIPRTLWIEKDRYLVLKEISGSREESAEFEGLMETRYTLVLQTAKINEPLPEALFSFVPPPEAREMALPFGSRPQRRGVEGEEARDFNLKDLKGESVELVKLRGKVVLLNFWATWCGPCRIEMPQIDRLQKEFKDRGLVALGISDEEPSRAREFLARHRISFPTLSDPEQTVAQNYQVDVIPTVLIINREGKIVYHGRGVSREDTLRNALLEAGLGRQ